VPLDSYRLEMTKVERAFIDGEEEGFAAIYTRRGSGEIVGATLVAAHAGEMISELTLAITQKIPLEALADTVHCYRTQAEVFQRMPCNTPDPGISRRPATNGKPLLPSLGIRETALHYD
jgi:pyruvate/2-oxoglutarate dehydrogenase complex dihydrolipoamide dehydrogenase (E3) component